MKPYYADDLVTLYHGDARELLFDADALITDPPFGVDFTGKRTIRSTTGYTTPDDADVGPAVVTMYLDLVKRAAVFPGTRNMFRYPEPRDVGCVFNPAGNGLGRWGFAMFFPVMFYGNRPTNEGYPASMVSSHTSDAMAKDHPCPKPLSWMTWLVRLASLPGETVVDPFAGSGTTLFAAKSLGRRAIGVELEERYCEVAATRCSQEVLGLESA